MRTVAVLVVAVGGFAVAGIAVLHDYTGTAVAVAAMVSYVTFKLLGDEQ